MKPKWSMAIIIFLILLSFVISIYLYPQMPERLASHWNIEGEVDGYMSRFWGVFLMPIILVIMSLLLIFVPRIDPLKENIAKFEESFYAIIALIVIFMFYVHVLTLAWNLGKRFNMSQMIIPAMGILFYFLGVLMSKAKRNWFIGIRTPWTLSSDAVWDKTHAVGATLFKLAGIIALLGFFLPDYAFYLVIVPVLLITLFTVVYSYILYRQEAKSKSPA